MSELCLTGFGLQAENHWREFLPRMVARLEQEGKLREALFEAQERTSEEMDRLQKELRGQGLTHQQAYDQAWEMIREQYIYLPPEED